MKNKVIGIVSPSSSVTADCPLRFNRGVSELKRLGYEVIIGSHAKSKTHHTAGTPEDRASDLMSMLLDPDTDIIMATIGGNNANEVLPHLDFVAIRNRVKSHKIFMGYSDNTILLQTLWRYGNVATIQGPSILTQFAEYGGIHSFTLKSFQAVTEGMNSNVNYQLLVADEWTDEYLAWDKQDIRAKKYSPNSGLWILRQGKSHGTLFGGNLRTWITLLGTEYAVLPENPFVFIEDVNENIGSIHRMLTQLNQAGILSTAQGLLIGRFEAKSSIGRDNLMFVIDRLNFPKGFPVIANMDFGHTDPMLSIPMGNMVQVDTDALQILIQL